MHMQCRIKTTTRRMMATVSELSMYQASAMKLAEENQASRKRACIVHVHVPVHVRVRVRVRVHAHVRAYVCMCACRPARSTRCALHVRGYACACARACMCCRARSGTHTLRPPTDLLVLSVRALCLQGRDEALRAQQANMEDNLPPSEGVAQEWLRFESGLDRRVADLTSRNVLAQTVRESLLLAVVAVVATTCCGSGMVVATYGSSYYLL